MHFKTILITHTNFKMKIMVHIFKFVVIILCGFFCNIYKGSERK